MKSVISNSPAFEDGDRKSKIIELLIIILKLVNGGEKRPDAPPSGCLMPTKSPDGSGDEGDASAYAEIDDSDLGPGTRMTERSVTAFNAGDGIKAFIAKPPERHDDVYDSYKECWPHLTKRQRQVVLLSFRDGLSGTDITRLLRLKSPSTVSEHLKAALKCRDDHSAKMLAKIQEEQRMLEAWDNRIKPKTTE